MKRPWQIFIIKLRNENFIMVSSIWPITNKKYTDEKNS
jgi:hypothetical protein